MLSNDQTTREPSRASPDRAGHSGPGDAATGRREEIRVQLRQLDFAAGQARLMPEPVQRKAAGAGAARDATPAQSELPAEDGNPVVERVNALQAHIDEAAKTWGVSAVSIKAMIATESSGVVDAKNGTFRGLLQVGEAAWNEVISKKKPEWKGWSFEDKWNDARCNILIGTGYRLVAKDYIDAALSRSGLELGDDEVLTITKMAYNAGAGTIAHAMELAGSTAIADFTKREFLGPAIEAKGIHVGYLKNALAGWLADNGAALGVTETSAAAVKKAHGAKLTQSWFLAQGQGAAYAQCVEDAVDQKYAEITSYGPKIKAWIETFGGEQVEQDDAGEVVEPGGGGAPEPVEAPVQIDIARFEALAPDALLGKLGEREAAEFEVMAERVNARLKGLGFVMARGPGFSLRSRAALKHFQFRCGLPLTERLDAVTWEYLQKPPEEIKALWGQ